MGQVKLAEFEDPEGYYAVTLDGNHVYLTVEDFNSAVDVSIPVKAAARIAAALAMAEDAAMEMEPLEAECV